ncbi:hypothetical protein ACFSHR_16370 [Azotobacter chroococcum]
MPASSSCTGSAWREPFSTLEKVRPITAAITATRMSTVFWRRVMGGPGR